MAKFTLEIEDGANGGMTVSIKGKDIATYRTAKTNTATQNLAVMIVSLLRDFGVAGDKLPSIDVPKK